MDAQRVQALTGLGVAGLGGLLAWGALDIPSDAGYAGVGPNFLPWLVAGGLLVCGALLTLQALRGGWAHVEAPSGAQHGDWSALAWVAAGIVVNASLITHLGFIPSCALCFVLAVRGLRLAEGKAAAGAAALTQAATDLLLGAAIAAPVFWVFTKLLNISLPGLTASGWL
ncbi:MAG: tripartite tricarboxylate transporter TctB family protein [Betaproteobacteria bacterium]|nr:tripartite tricarboxylate transporter TctB family protein [Betaproteobacteria bacterium]